MDLAGRGNKKIPRRGGVTIFLRRPRLRGMGERRFRTRIDAWLALLVAGGALTPLLMAGWLASQGRTDGVLLLAGWGTAVSALVASLTMPVRYTLREDRLLVRSGWLTWDIPLAAVRRVRPTWSPLAGPAWSLRRVLIEWSGGDFILVSPDDRESFIDEIAARCPQLIRRGDGLEIRTPHP